MLFLFTELKFLLEIAKQLTGLGVIDCILIAIVFVINSKTIIFAQNSYKMDGFLSNIPIRVNEHTYLKDPESSELGKKIISGSINLIDNIGFDDFTFRKLGKTINTTEASIYRYFENKHKLLLYLTDWYWRWMDYRFIFSTMNIKDPEERLSRALKVVTEKIKQDGSFAHINEVKLQKLIFEESSKAYFNKKVDKENKLGVYGSYKNLVEQISQIVLEIKPSFKYPHMLISTVIEGAHHQRFFAEHLPGLTDQIEDGDAISLFYKNLVYKALTLA